MTYKGTTNGDAVYEVGSGSYRFLAAVTDATSVNARRQRAPSRRRWRSASPRRSLRRVHAGRGQGLRDRHLTATVTSTAGDATLSVHDPSATAPGHLVNGSNVLPQPLQVNGNDVIGLEQPDAAADLDRPGQQRPAHARTSQQSVGANDPLRTGSYAKTLTFTLSTTTP